MCGWVGGWVSDWPTLGKCRNKFQMTLRQIVITIPTTEHDGGTVTRGRTEMSLEEFCQLNISQSTMARILADFPSKF